MTAKGTLAARLDLLAERIRQRAHLVDGGRAVPIRVDLDAADAGILTAAAERLGRPVGAHDLLLVFFAERGMVG